MKEQVSKFRSLFQGMEEAYGYYNVTPGRPGEKLLGERDTKRAPVTTALWEMHLKGEQGLGIIPIMKDNHCWWGCIDIDKYDTDHKLVVKKIQQNKLPLVVCRSKSGGAHVFIFFKEPVPAKEVQAKLRAVAASLGYGGCEIFPKQTQVFTDKGDLGSWLNLPYFDAENTMRYAFDDKAQTLSLDDFFKYVAKKKVTRAELAGLSESAPVQELEGGPPCLQHLVAQGFPEGTRNNGLTALCVFAKKAYPDNWQRKVEEYNQKFMDPPLTSQEVHDIIRSAERKDYGYKCKDQPISSFCNSGVCRTRQYGIGVAGTMPTFGSLTKIDTAPPTWFLDINEKRLELETEDLQNPKKFQKKCMDVINQMPPCMKADPWQQLIQHLLESVTIVPAPGEASAEGFFYELFQNFTSSDRTKAKSKDELITGKPWYDQETGSIYFRLTDLMAFLNRNKFVELTRQQIAAKLKKLGAEHDQLKIKGQCVRVFFLKMEQEKLEALDTPAMPKEVF